MPDAPDAAAQVRDPLDELRTIRFLMFEVWEDGKGEFPLFVTSNGHYAAEYVAAHPGDTITKRYWTRERP